MLVKNACMVIDCWVVTLLWLSSIAFATAAVRWNGVGLTLGFRSDNSDDSGNRGWGPTSVTKSIYGYTGKSSIDNHKATRTVARGGSSMFADSKRPPKLPSRPWEHHNQAHYGVDVSDRAVRRKHGYEDTSTVDHESLIDTLESSSEFELEQEISAALENDLRENLAKPTVDIAFHYENFGPRQLRSIPFLILTPNVDHWKMTAETLASFGYSVFVCERRDPTQERGTADVVKILDGLGWKHAIVVGCDEEATWAMEAAMDLSPRVAGLVLVGDLSEASSYVHDATKVHSPIGPDLYLSATLECPFRIVWDGGDGQQVPADILHHRSLVLGGGLSPHRRQPDQVAWTLARFSNEEVVPPSSSDSVMRVITPTRSRSNLFRRLIPDSLQEFWTRLVGVWQVSERAIAGIILLIAGVNVFCYQLNNVHGVVMKLRRLQEMLLSPGGLWKAISTGFSALFSGVFSGSSSRRSRAIPEEVAVAISDYIGDTTAAATESSGDENAIVVESSSTENERRVLAEPVEILPSTENSTISDFIPRDIAFSSERKDESCSADDDFVKNEAQEVRETDVLVPRWADGSEVTPPREEELQNEKRADVVIPRWVDGSEVTPPVDLTEAWLRRLSPSRRA